MLISCILFQLCAVSKMTVEVVLITRLNGFSILNTVAVQDFGTVDVTEIKTGLKRKKNAKLYASNLLDRVKKLVFKPFIFHFNKLRNLTLLIYADVCYLPKSVGPCEGYYPTWYYDHERKHCAQFVYGGCLGNNNRFQTREECENLCVASENTGMENSHKNI